MDSWEGFWARVIGGMIGWIIFTILMHPLATRKELEAMRKELATLELHLTNTSNISLVDDDGSLLQITTAKKQKLYVKLTIKEEASDE